VSITLVSNLHRMVPPGENKSESERWPTKFCQPTDYFDEE